MAEDLWKLRKRRGMSVKQLANKSGVPALSIQEYERGEPIRIADLSRLAKALFVDEFEINIQSETKPEQPPPRRPPHPAQTQEAKPVKPAAKPQQPKPVQMARPTQLRHLLELAGVLGQDEATVIEAAGKPLEELTRQEASALLHDYTEQIKTFKASEEAHRPEGTRRKRAHLPEGVDEYELKYLTECREAGDQLTFTLLDGREFTGRIAGFSPYFITIEQEDGTETSLHKLALAYYHRRPAPVEESA